MFFLDMKILIWITMNQAKTMQGTNKTYNNLKSMYANVSILSQSFIFHGVVEEPNASAGC